MRLNKVHHRVFFEHHGLGPHKCFHCGEIIEINWDPDDDKKGRSKHSFAIHHLNEDHSDNSPENLAPSHYSCHVKHHRVSRPLVASGSKLPEEWAQNIGASVRRRYEFKNPEWYESWLAATVAGMRRVDKTPTWCSCGKGPFEGQHGLGLHQSRSCEVTGSTLGSEIAARENRDPVWCDCGKGPFKGQRAITQHKTWGCEAAGTNLAQQRAQELANDPQYCDRCGRGPFKGRTGVLKHQAKNKLCDS